MKTLILLTILLTSTICYSQTVSIIDYGINVLTINKNGEISSAYASACKLTYINNWSKDSVLLLCTDTIHVDHKRMCIAMDASSWTIGQDYRRLNIGEYCIMPKLQWNKIIYVEVEQEKYRKIERERKELNRQKLLKLIK